MTPFDKEMVDLIVQQGYNYRSRLWAFNALLDYRLFSEPTGDLIQHRKKRRWLKR